ncbi:MAG: CD225/dispanin family protein [Pirellulales bacterium]
MFCRQCGYACPDGSTRCTQCGSPLTPPASQNPYASGYHVNVGNSAPISGEGKPPNYLVHAIISTVLCCWPLGIVAIVFAAQVDSKWYAGDQFGARHASNQAKTWAWISFGIGIVVIAIYVVAIIAAEAGGGRRF